jgi:hypothetical protein
MQTQTIFLEKFGNQKRPLQAVTANYDFRLPALRSIRFPSVPAAQIENPLASPKITAYNLIQVTPCGVAKTTFFENFIVW